MIICAHESGETPNFFLWGSAACGSANLAWDSS